MDEVKNGLRLSNGIKDWVRFRYRTRAKWVRGGVRITNTYPTYYLVIRFLHGSFKTCKNTHVRWTKLKNPALTLEVIFLFSFTNIIWNFSVNYSWKIKVIKLNAYIFIVQNMYVLFNRSIHLSWHLFFNFLADF